ncbi:MAG: cytidylate kinase family protein [Alphaproteobacteria bacterium]
MPIITIYQGASGSGQELAETVAAAMGYRCWGRAELVEAARRYGIIELKLNELVKNAHQHWQPLSLDIGRYRCALQAALCEAVLGGTLVYHGHSGQELLGGIRHVVKVLLTAPMEFRIETIKARQGVSEEEARRYIEVTDEARSRRLMAMFGVDWRDPSRYDLALNRSRISRDSAAQIIVEVAQLEEYQLTDQSEQQFEDLSLAARVSASLASSPECSAWNLQVRAENGHVYISGNDQPGISRAQVVQVAQRVPGVNQITTDFGGRLTGGNGGIR